MKVGQLSTPQALVVEWEKAREPERGVAGEFLALGGLAIA